VLTPFHIAIQVRDIAEARRFYGEVLGCAEGRSAPDWVDFNMYGHQFVCHLNPQLGPHGRIGAHFNPVDGQGVPVPHCGVVLEPHQWQELAARLRGCRESNPRSSFWILPGTRSNSNPSPIFASCSPADARAARLFRVASRCRVPRKPRS
jgi:extradiol dioxygenase family protein